MAETVDELSINYEEDGLLLCKELDRYVLSRGGWATVMFLYQDYNRKSGAYGPKKVTIRRYQKRGGMYMPRSRFNVSSMDQARKIVQALQNWVAQEG